MYSQILGIQTHFNLNHVAEEKVVDIQKTALRSSNVRGRFLSDHLWHQTRCLAAGRPTASVGNKSLAEQRIMNADCMVKKCMTENSSGSAALSWKHGKAQKPDVTAPRS